MYPTPIAIINITGIKQTTDDGVQVIRANGKTLWLPRLRVDFLPGRVVVPRWLMAKIERKEQLSN
jgi:hypothetical protein